MIYLDNNATTQPDDEVVAVMQRALRECWANPSSVHRPGQAVRQQIELAREQVARLIGARDREIVFTSGGTEAVNLAIRGSIGRRHKGTEARRHGGKTTVKGRRGEEAKGRWEGQAPSADRRAPAADSCLITNRLEHSAVRDTAEAMSDRSVEVVWLHTNVDGVIEIDSLREALETRAGENTLVSIMWANNETGVIQPVLEIGEICREHGVHLHVDATQYVGKMPVNVGDMPIDLMSFAAHKFHGPKGVGALYVRTGVRIERQITGGPQERERRGGTENVPGIIGMGEAARSVLEFLRDEEARRSLAALRDRFEQAILQSVPDASINGQADPNSPRLWNTTNIAFPGLDAEAILLMLSERGVCASAGAACSSGSLDPSPVLLAMGVPEDRAHGSVRFSLSRTTHDDELTQAAEIVIATVGRLQALSAST